MIKPPRFAPLSLPGTGTSISVPEATGVEVPAARVVLVVPVNWPVLFRQFSWSIYNLDRPEGCTLQTVEVEAHDISAMRNLGIAKARTLDATHVAFIDADMVPPADTLTRLLSHNLPVVGGLCRKRRSPWEPCLWGEVDGALAIIQPQGDGLLPVEATGGACLLIEMGVFDALEETYPGEPYFYSTVNRPDIPEPDQVSEDLWFCLRVRACDVPLYVDQSLKIGHITTAVIIDDDDHRAVALFK